MRLLLDTQIALWAWTEPEQFVPRAVDRSGFDYLPIQDSAIYFLDRLPKYHR